MTDSALLDLRERIRAAAASKTPLAIRGGGSKDFYGNAIVGDVLDTTGYCGIVDYDPTELVVTARAGTPLVDIERELRGSGQMLGCEPPHFGARATLGGMVAAGLSGPRRPFSDSIRDIVLGVRILDGNGGELGFGGRVIKNVAGFDVSRLMTGALGTLGVLTEISLKCVPLPKVEATRMLQCSADEAIRMTNKWVRKALPVSATCYHAGNLSVRLSGAPPAVESAEKKIGGMAVEGAGDFWFSVREQTHAHFAGAAATGGQLWRLSVKSTAPFADFGGSQMIEWSGALRWLAAGVAVDPATLRSWAQSNGGHATLFRAAEKRDGAFHPLANAVQQLHRRLKATFDPNGILNRGRLYADF